MKGLTVTRVLPNICTDRMEETRDFYAGFLGFVVGFEHRGWYIQMASPTNPQLQIGIVSRSHEFTPKEFQQPARGVIISAQVEDVDAAHAAALKGGFSVVRFMVADPNGLLVNVFSFPG
jgi:catechol 2,3-dioxygenase-like lactoylglutathione lyase family enzyme